MVKGRKKIHETEQSLRKYVAFRFSDSNRKEVRYWTEQEADDQFTLCSREEFANMLPVLFNIHMPVIYLPANTDYVSDGFKMIAGDTLDDLDL